MIHVKNLTKLFHNSNNYAVNVISFSVTKGEIVALLGENGAGKTTTLRMIATLLKPTKGSCIVNNYNVTKNPAKVRQQLGFLLGGEIGLYDRLSAYENIDYFARLHGLPANESKSRITQLSSLLHMEKYINKRCNTFSRGMKQKTAIARSIIHNPPILILDEPTTGLDVSSSKIFQDFMLNYKTQGGTILFSSHNITEVKKIADRVVIMHKGEIIEDGIISLLENKYQQDLQTLFLTLIGNKT